MTTRNDDLMNDDQGQGQGGGGRDWRALEKARDDAVKERDDAVLVGAGLLSFKVGRLFADAGFPTDDKGDLLGVGRLAADAYDGDLTVDAIKAFANERQIPMDGTVPPPPVLTPEQAMAVAVAASQGRTDQVGSMATAPPAPPSDALAAAEGQVRAYEAASEGGAITEGEIAAITAMQQAHIAERRARGLG